jgi:hypothetical protein
MTVAIAYAGGTYGTYLEWCLTVLSENTDIKSPFRANGNSHEFQGNHLMNMDGWKKLHGQDIKPQFVRLHPKISRDESISENLEQLCEQSDFVLHLYPTDRSMMLCINNYFTKIHEDWWYYQFQHIIDNSKIYENWPVSKNTAIADVSPWIKREFLSFYLMPAWHSMVEWYHPSRWHHEKCLVIDVDDLLFDFESTLNKIQYKTGIQFTRPIDDLHPYHILNISNQKFLHIDRLCHEIVDAVCDNIDLDWQPIGLCSESWVQWELRNRGFEIQCYNLDVFPTNSVQLRKLIYST